MVEGEVIVKNEKQQLLTVYFFRPFGFNIFGQDYQILEYDKEYQWVLVGDPKMKMAWILSRTETMKENDIIKAKQACKNNSYEFSRFRKTSTK